MLTLSQGQRRSYHQLEQCQFHRRCRVSDQPTVRINFRGGICAECKTRLSATTATIAGSLMLLRLLLLLASVRLASLHVLFSRQQHAGAEVIDVSAPELIEGTV